MAKTTIRYWLDEAGIDYAIHKVEQYKREFLEKVDKLVKTLVQHGKEVASIQIAELDAVYSGELLGSLEGFFFPASHVGIIKAYSDYAIYVEFGTGVVGSESPHPNPNGYIYDVNNHGDKGWVYYDKNSDTFKWTKGFKSRPFMYNTARQLEKECKKIAVEVFGK